MNAYFRTPERIAKLLYVAGLWRGTPWIANSQTRGVGVSCHNLPRAIYSECGHSQLPEMVGTPDQTNAENLMAPWIDARPEFERVDHRHLNFAPGTLLGLWLARDQQGRRVKLKHTNHLGVVLGERCFVHVLMHKKTDIDLVNVPPWSQRIVAAWRPLEINL